nr:transcription elongation factor B polypeptide 3 [Ipomoea batatas]
MKQKKVTFKWNQLYKAKLKEVEEAQQKSFERIRDLYKKQDAEKQSRQIKLCTKVPPSSNKRSFYGGMICIYVRVLLFKHNLIPSV